MTFTSKIKISLSVAVLSVAALALSFCANTAPNTNTTASCSNTPARASVITGTTTASSASAVSHRSGEDCLSCHKTGGQASNSIFITAGTVYTSTAGTTLAAAGTTLTTGTNNTPATLAIDTCGNFYTTAGIFTNAVGARVGTGTAMGNGGNNNATDASCNQSGCHTVVDQGRIF